VVIAGLGEAQFGEDVVHVFLDGALGDQQSVGDADVGNVPRPSAPAPPARVC
jgi:hypothetical protein